jgi:kexin
MPTEEDENYDDPDDAHFHTTSINVPSSTALQEHPTDHPDRPVNEKPSAPSTADAKPTPTKPSHTDEEEVGTKPDTSESASPSPSESFLLPSIFPTFGVSPRTQIWIYGAIAAIIIFCVALGSYLFFQRRRKQGIDRDDYEFAILQDEDAGEGPRGAPQKRRGGELYDAFAGESDEEEQFFSDDEGPAEYHDEDEKGGMLRSQDGSNELDEKSRARD